MSRVNIVSIPSRLPGWYDTKAPGFKAPPSWKGCRVRVVVPIASDPGLEIQAARARLEKMYPGALLHLVPDLQRGAKPENIDVRGGDDAVLGRYLEKATLPEGVSADQVKEYLSRFLSKLGLFGVQGLRFKTFEATETLSFKTIKFDLNRRGLTLVSGSNEDWNKDGLISNGAGKSGFVNIPFIALFGRTFKEQKHDEWACDQSDLPAKVTQVVQLPDGRDMRVSRGRRPSLLRAWIEDSEITMGKPEATQALIERVTNFTLDVATNAVYIGQREVGSVFGTEKERKELFSRLIGLDRFLDATTALRKALGRCQRSLDETENEAEHAKSALDEARSGLEGIEEQLARVPAVSERAARDAALEISRLESLAREGDRQNAALDEELDKNQKVFEALLFKGLDARAGSEQLAERLLACQAVEGDCPTCGSATSAAALQKYAKGLKNRIEESDETFEQYEEKKRRNRSLRAVLAERFQKNAQEAKRSRAALEMLRQDAARLEEARAARERLESLRDQNAGRVRELSRTQSVHEQAAAATRDEKRFIEACARVVGRDGLPAYLCAVVAPQLNAAAARYSEIFSDGEIGLEFQISDGEIDVQICNLHGGRRVKDQSAGEMRMAGIISAFAFRDALVGHNILILDEPGDGLDPTNAAVFARALNKIKERFEHVLIISHNAAILANLEPDFHVQITKKDRTSTINEV